MAETIVDLPDGFTIDGEEISEDLLKKAMDALAKQENQKAKNRERRAKMTDAEKAEQAERAKRRRAVVALKVKYADDNNYEPTEEAINAFLAAA